MEREVVWGEGFQRHGGRGKIGEKRLFGARLRFLAFRK